MFNVDEDRVETAGLTAGQSVPASGPDTSSAPPAQDCPPLAPELLERLAASKAKAAARKLSRAALSQEQLDRIHAQREEAREKAKARSKTRQPPCSSVTVNASGSSAQIAETRAQMKLRLLRDRVQAKEAARPPNGKAD